MTTPAPQTGPPPIGRHGLAVRAAMEGKAAAQAGASPHACPYAASRPFSRRAWLLGFTAGRPQEDKPELDPDPVVEWPGDTAED